MANQLVAALRLTATQSEVAAADVALTSALPATSRRGARFRRVTNRATTSYDVAARDVAQNALPAVDCQLARCEWLHLAWQSTLGRG